VDDKKSISTTKWAVLNLIFYFSTLAINYLGSSGFFNGMGQKDISDKYTTLITPATFAFSIWGVIYGLLLITLIYFFIKRKDPRASKVVELISPLFILSSVFNIGWIVTFSYELLGISTILIFAMLFSLIIIIEKIYKNRAEISYILPILSFTLYSAWVFIASVINVALFLVQKNWGGLGISNSIWTIIVLFIAIAFVLFYLSQYKNAIFPISVAWGFFGIYKSYTNGKLSPPMSSTIEIVLLGGIVIFIISIIATFVRNGNSILPSKKT